MAILSKGVTFADGEQVTSTRLNNLVDQATFAANAVDGSTMTLINGELAVGVVQTANIGTNAITESRISDGAVSAAKLAPGAAVPSGAIMPFAMNAAPTGWLAADGAAVNRTTFASLFAAIGTTYGDGDGSTTFNLPDLRGYFVRGSGTNADGTASAAFGTKQADEFKSHSHTTVGRYMSIDGGEASFNFGGSGQYPYRNDINSTGGDETRPKNIAMLYCIKT